MLKHKTERYFFLKCPLNVCIFNDLFVVNEIRGRRNGLENQVL